MSEYAVHVTTTGRIDPDDEDRWDELIEAEGDAPHFAAFGARNGGLEAQLTVQASDLHEAGRRGADALTEAMADIGVTGEVVAVEVMTADEFDRWLNRPQRPDDLVSTYEAAVILGVSRQRVHQLADSDPEFPEGVRVGNAVLRSGSALRRYEKRERHPGPRVKSGR